MTWGRKYGRKEMRRRYGSFSDLPDAGNEAQSTNCYSRNSKGWLPEMGSLQQGHLCRTHGGRLGMDNPPNTSDDSAGFNTKMWQGYDNVADALRFLGYKGTDGYAVIHAFQVDWNRVVQRVATDPRFKRFDWHHVPSGNLVADSEVGARTLNALEVAVKNQSGVAWKSLVMAAKDPMTLGRKHLYSAK